MIENFEINPNEVYPVPGTNSVTYVRPTIKKPIINDVDNKK